MRARRSQRKNSEGAKRKGSNKLYYNLTNKRKNKKENLKT